MFKSLHTLKNGYIFVPTNKLKHKTMNLINLTTINNENFEAIVSNLIGTDCDMEFANATTEHERIALNLGLTTIMLSDNDNLKTLIVKCETEDINAWA